MYGYDESHMLDQIMWTMADRTAPRHPVRTTGSLTDI